MKQLLKMTLLLILFIGGFAPLSVVAQNGAEQISSFELEATVNEFGSAVVTETIVYDFSSKEKRGIFIDIPTQYVVSGDQGYKVGIAVASVTRDGNEEPFMIEKNTQFDRLRIGDPDVLITGEHTYELLYTIDSVVIDADDSTQVIRIDAPGNDWSVPVLSSKVDITAPFDAVAETCYQGELESTSQTCQKLLEGGFRSSGVLQPGQSLTIEKSYPAGSFSITQELATLDLGESSLSEKIVSAGILIIGVGAAVGVGLTLIITKVRHEKRKKEEVVYPRYQPPEDLGPAEIGLLSDNSSNGVELSATLVQLAVLGHLKIEQVRPRKWYRVAEYAFHRRDSSSTLKPYQAALLKGMFGDDSKTTISTKKIKKDSTFIKAVSSFHVSLEQQLTSLGFYKKDANFSIALDSKMSDDGYTKWAEVEGFKTFLAYTEADRMAMLEAPERKPEQFSEFLPYAIALGVEKQWADQFKDLNINVDSWYQGGRVINSAYLASNLSSGLGAVATATARSSGSSGSGGGFSGGGFSGGGGGSW